MSDLDPVQSTKLTDDDEIDFAKIATRDDLVKALSALAGIIGIDDLAVPRQAQVVVRTDGRKALAVDSRTVVESTFGFDQNPDAYFRIIDTGGAGTTWTIDIAGTSVDPSPPRS